MNIHYWKPRRVRADGDYSQSITDRDSGGQHASESQRSSDCNSKAIDLQPRLRHPIPFDTLLHLFDKAPSHLGHGLHGVPVIPRFDATRLPRRIPRRDPLHNNRTTIRPERLAPAKFLRSEAKACCGVVPIADFVFGGQAGRCAWDEGGIAAAGDAGFLARGRRVGANEVAKVAEGVADCGLW